MPDVLIRGSILTMDPVRPRAASVLVREGRIVALDPSPAPTAAATIEVQAPAVVLPAFIDPHVHLLAAAARKLSVECSSESVPSIDELVAVLRAKARETPPGEWIRATGYDETALAERRHPNRHDLDRATTDHPVRLLHRTGHACVLNSLAMARAGIDTTRPEPPGGYMERSLEDGEPTGFFIEMNDVIEAAVPPLPFEELLLGMKGVNAELLRSGIAWIGDATAHNGSAEWRLIERLMGAGALTVGVSMMESVDVMGSLPDAAIGGRLRTHGVKLMPRETEHEVYPPANELATAVARIAASGKQAAVHAVGRVALESVLEAFDAAAARDGRVEHAAVCSSEAAVRIAGLGLAVVGQPGFIYWSGDGYLEKVPSSQVPDLYALRRLLDAGVLVAGSSDMPVSPPDVLTSIRAAVERRTRSGATLTPEQAISPEEALGLYTLNAARVAGLEHERGTISPAKAADSVVLSHDPAAAGADLSRIRVEGTIIGGEVAFEREGGFLRRAVDV